MARALLALGILLHALQAGAATNELTTQLQQPKRFKATLLAQTESNLFETESKSYDAKGKMNLGLSYKLAENYRAGLTGGFIQEYDGGREATGTNWKATVTRVPIAVTQDSSLVLVGGGRLPTNVQDRDKNSFNGSLLTETSLITNWTLAGVPFATVYGLYLTKNFHDYDRGASGKANTDYIVINYFGVEKYITSKLSFLVDGDYTYARTYQGSLRTLFSIGQSFTYEFNQDLSVTVGHSNGGDALAVNGTDYDISVFDGNTSVIYANLRAVY